MSRSISGMIAEQEANRLKMTTALKGVDRCPHCFTAHPTLQMQWQSEGPTKRADGQGLSVWAAYSCWSCGGMLLAKGVPGNFGVAGLVPIMELYPQPRKVSSELPETARRFLQQAIETLNAPDAAAVMAGSAVDAMLKHIGYIDGSLYSRIDKARQDGHLTAGMAEWAHHVRLGSNRPRHADIEKPHVEPDEAKQSVDFAEALGLFLFTLTARVQKGIEASAAT